METKDISKRTVLVLLILTLVISVVGTWTILSQPSTIYKTVNDLGRNTEGKVAINVLDGPPEPVQQTVENKDGQVSIKILEE